MRDFIHAQMRAEVKPRRICENTKGAGIAYGYDVEKTIVEFRVWRNFHPAPIKTSVGNTELSDAQSPLAGWERPSRKFAAGADPAPKWSDFVDPLDAISGRFGRIRERNAQPARFSKPERQALSVLGLGEDVDRHALRQTYSALVRRYHPDKNGGDRSHEARLTAVIEAYQLLRKSAALA